MTQKFYTTTQAAKLFSVNNDTILRWAKNAGLQLTQNGTTYVFTDSDITDIRVSRESGYTVAQAAKMIHCRYGVASEVAKLNNIGTLMPPGYKVRTFTDEQIEALTAAVAAFRADEEAMKKAQTAPVRRRVGLVSTQLPVSCFIPNEPVYIETTLNGARYLQRVDAPPAPREGVGYTVDRRQMRPCG